MLQVGSSSQSRISPVCLLVRYVGSQTTQVPKNNAAAAYGQGGGMGLGDDSPDERLNAVASRERSSR